MTWLDLTGADFVTRLDLGMSIPRLGSSCRLKTRHESQQHSVTRYYNSGFQVSGLLPTGPWGMPSPLVPVMPSWVTATSSLRTCQLVYTPIGSSTSSSLLLLPLSSLEQWQRGLNSELIWYTAASLQVNKQTYIHKNIRGYSLPLFPGCIVTWTWSLAKGQYM